MVATRSRNRAPGQVSRAVQQLSTRPDRRLSTRLGQPHHHTVMVRVANNLVALISEKALVDLWPVCHSAIGFDVIVAEDDPFTRRQTAQALVPCGRR